MLMEFLENVIFFQGYFDIVQARKDMTHLFVHGRGYQFLKVKELHW